MTAPPSPLVPPNPNLSRHKTRSRRCGGKIMDSVRLALRPGIGKGSLPVHQIAVLSPGQPGHALLPTSPRRRRRRVIAFRGADRPPAESRTLRTGPIHRTVFPRWSFRPSLPSIVSSGLRWPAFVGALASQWVRAKPPGTSAAALRRHSARGVTVACELIPERAPEPNEVFLPPPVSSKFPRQPGGQKR